MIRRTLVVAAIAAAAVLVPLPAHAASADIEYSLDGMTWSAEVPASVLDAAWTPVPGAEATATLFVRSARVEPTVVAVFAGSATSSDAAVLAATTVTGDGGAPLVLDDVAACASLMPQAVLAQGEALRVPLAVALDAGLTSGQSATVGLDLLIDLSDVGPTTLANGCPVDPAIVPVFPVDPAQPAAPDLPLASTGAAFPTGAVAAAGALILGGAAAFGLGRRRRAAR